MHSTVCKDASQDHGQEFVARPAVEVVAIHQSAAFAAVVAVDDADANRRHVEARTLARREDKADTEVLMHEERSNGDGKDCVDERGISSG